MTDLKIKSITCVEGSKRPKRPHGLVICLNCEGEFWKQVRFINKSPSHYCSRECLYEYKDKQKLRVICNFCEKEFPITASRKAVSKSGHVFCSRSCKDTAQIIEHGYTDMHPSHYADGIHAKYRKRALRELGTECSICGYNIVAVLEVHHKDGNRKNNKISNLDVLCPTHHVEYEVGILKYNTGD